MKLIKVFMIIIKWYPIFLNKKILCYKHFHTYISDPKKYDDIKDKCFSCSKIIYIDPVILDTKEKKMFHKFCFKCKQCSKSLTLNNFYLNEKEVNNIFFILKLYCNIHGKIKSSGTDDFGYEHTQEGVAKKLFYFIEEKKLTEFKKEVKKVKNINELNKIWGLKYISEYKNCVSEHYCDQVDCPGSWKEESWELYYIRYYNYRSDISIIYDKEINGVKNISWSLLHLTTLFDRFGITKELINLGADYYLKDELGNSPYDIAVKMINHKDSKTWFKKYIKLFNEMGKFILFIIDLKKKFFNRYKYYL
jgi:hypothetical protein